MNFILLQDPTGIVGQVKDVEKGTAVSGPHSRSRRKRRNSVKEVSLDMLPLEDFSLVWSTNETLI